MSSYYNEHDMFAAAWLRELIKDGQITDGTVDERDIQDVQPADLRGFDRCHFFAGIGGWDHALKLAGWPDDRPIWTGSCPCQPFSAAGKGKGGADDRHLWPHWFRLLRECRPTTVFGEQVADAIGHGWLDLVSTDLEGEGYAVGAVVLGAHSVGAPHIRQRLWFVAESDGRHALDGHLQRGGQHGLRAQGGRADGHTRDGERTQGVVAESKSEQHNWGGEPRRGRGEPAGLGDAGELADTDDNGAANSTSGHVKVASLFSGAGGLDLGFRGGFTLLGKEYARLPFDVVWANDISPAAWAADSLEWLPCRDGKARPTQPGLQPLAHGVSARVGRLRGYGNAIVPQVAAEVIRAYMDVATWGLVERSVP